MALTTVGGSFAEVRRLAEAGRLSESLDLMHELADQEHPEALITLADFYWRGGPVAPDPGRARDLFRRASDAGNPWGRAFYTNLLASGIYGDRDWQGAIGRLRDEASSDPARARIFAVLDAMDIDGAGEPRAVAEPRPLSESLEVGLCEGLFTTAECDLLLATAEPRYMPSTVQDTAGRETPHPLRSSEGAPLHWLIEDPAIQAMNRRLAAATGTAYEQAEPLLILRYRPGQEYRRHFDALPGLANQRVKTALVYLNDDYSGGETEFPRLGLKVKGRKGDALIFRNANDDGTPDPLSEHAGLPVVSGVKHLASRWIRAERHLP